MKPGARGSSVVEAELMKRGWRLMRRATGDYAVVRFVGVRMAEVEAVPRYMREHGDAWVDRWLADVEADVIVDRGDAA